MKLRNVLLTNALSSAASGLLLILFPAATARLFEVANSGLFLATGLFLFFFAGMVYYASRQEEVDRNLVRTIVSLDIAWVVASLLVVFLPWLELSLWGDALTLGVALWVATMAYLQHAGLKQYPTASTNPSS